MLPNEMPPPAANPLLDAFRNAFQAPQGAAPQPPATPPAAPAPPPQQPQFSQQGDTALGLGSQAQFSNWLQQQLQMMQTAGRISSNLPSNTICFRSGAVVPRSITGEYL